MARRDHLGRRDVTHAGLHGDLTIRRAILVSGFFGHGNVGDEAFREAFHELWGDRAEFVFADEIPAAVNDYNALVVGGGSFFHKPLSSRIRLEDVTVPVGFVGVGLHDPVHPAVVPWLDRAAVVVVRDFASLSAVGSRGIVLPDLVFARGTVPAWDPYAAEGRVLVLLNGYAAPRPDASRWHCLAWDRFECELAAVLDDLPADAITFMPMMAGETGPDDRYAAARVASQMRDRSRVVVDFELPDETALLAEIARSGLVVSSRFHGIVFSIMSGAPVVGVSAHEKVRTLFADNGLENFVEFYGFTREPFFEAVRRASVRTDEIRTNGSAAWLGSRDMIWDRLFSSGITPAR